MVETTCLTRYYNIDNMLKIAIHHNLLKHFEGWLQFQLVFLYLLFIELIILTSLSNGIIAKGIFTTMIEDKLQFLYTLNICQFQDNCKQQKSHFSHTITSIDLCNHK